MNNHIKCLEAKDIKVDSDSKLSRKSILNHSSKFWQSLHHIWQSFLDRLMADPCELQVEEKVDRYGNKYWQAYDPLTGSSFSSGSEIEVGMWIEQRYRRR